MVKVMPNQNLASALPKAPRAAVIVAASTLLLLSASGVAQAALQQASPDDSSSFWTYGISIILVLLLVALVAFKKIRASKKEVDVPAKSSGRTNRSENTHLTSGRVAPPDPGRLEERRSQAREGAQGWEKTQPA